MSSLFKQTLRMAFMLVTIVVAIGGFLIADGSLAWFSENTKNKVEGFSVTVEAVPSLIIAKTVEEIGVKNQTQLRVQFDDISATDMVAVTHDDAIADTYLKYLENHYAVDNHTGNVKPGFTLEFSPVPTDGEGTYFVDYVVYIASAYTSFEVESLSAVIVPPAEFDGKPPHFYAASIDFYIGEVSLEGYCGTTSVAKATGEDDDGYVELLTDGVIPLNTEGYIKVIMRCYFDGALQNEQTGDAYVNSFTVTSDGVNIGVKFLVEEAKNEEN